MAPLGPARRGRGAHSARAGDVLASEQLAANDLLVPSSAPAAIQYATFRRRFWALVLDGLFVLLAWWVLAAITEGRHVPELLAAIVALHHVGLVTEGGTLGKRLLGMRVVRAHDGGRVDVVHAIVREVMRLFVSFPPLGLGFLWMLDHPERRTWHDLAAGSVVVHELPEAVHLQPAWAVAPPWRQAD